MLRRPLAPALVALGCLLATALVWVLAFHSGGGARLDRAVLEGCTSLAGTPAEPLAAVGADLTEPVPFALLAIGLLAAALVRLGTRCALVVGGILAAASLTTQLLKQVATVSRPVPAPPDSLVGNAWPSGHTTGAVALALCLLLVVPAGRRRLAAGVGGLFVLAEVSGLLVMGWHYPSDVIAGVGVATAWAALGVIALRGARAPSGAGRPARPPGRAVPER